MTCTLPLKYNQTQKPTSYHAHKTLFQKRLRFSTTKKLDAEAVYYFGARYLDPRTSRWLGVDPAMGEYVPSAGQENKDLPNGGVYNYTNLHTFHYSNNNPVKYKDPDGETPRYAPVENAVNLDFGKDYMALAEANFKEGHYGLAAIMTLDAVCEAGYNTLAAYGGASVIGAVSSLIGSLSIKKNQEIISKATDIVGDLTGAAQKAVQKLGAGKGPVYGTKAYKLFEFEVKALGNSKLKTEISFSGGEQVKRGFSGSVRLDVVEQTGGKINRVFDLKTGSAKLTSDRIKDIQNAVGANVPVIEIKP